MRYDLVTSNINTTKYIFRINYVNISFSLTNTELNWINTTLNITANATLHVGDANLNVNMNDNLNIFHNVACTIYIIANNTVIYSFFKWKHAI